MVIVKDGRVCSCPRVGATLALPAFLLALFVAFSAARVLSATSMWCFLGAAVLLCVHGVVFDVEAAERAQKAGAKVFASRFACVRRGFAGVLLCLVAAVLVLSLFAMIGRSVVGELVSSVFGWSVSLSVG